MKSPLLILAETNLAAAIEATNPALEVLNKMQARVDILRLKYFEALSPYQQAVALANDEQKKMLTAWSGTKDNKQRYLIKNSKDPFNSRAWLRHSVYKTEECPLDWNWCLNNTVVGKHENNIGVVIGESSMPAEEAFRLADIILAKDGWILTDIPVQE